MKSLLLNLPDTQMTYLSEFAADSEVAKSTIVRQAINDYLKSKGYPDSNHLPARKYPIGRASAVAD